MSSIVQPSSQPPSTPPTGSPPAFAGLEPDLRTVVELDAASFFERLAAYERVVKGGHAYLKKYFSRRGSSAVLEEHARVAVGDLPRYMKKNRGAQLWRLYRKAIESEIKRPQRAREREKGNKSLSGPGHISGLDAAAAVDIYGSKPSFPMAILKTDPKKKKDAQVDRKLGSGDKDDQRAARPSARGHNLSKTGRMAAFSTEHYSALEVMRMADLSVALVESEFHKLSPADQDVVRERLSYRRGKTPPTPEELEAYKNAMAQLRKLVAAVLEKQLRGEDARPMIPVERRLRSRLLELVKKNQLEDILQHAAKTR